MEKPPSSNLPDRPKLRPAISEKVQHQGQSYLRLSDPTGLVEEAVLVPQALVTLLTLCDGSRDVSALQVGMMLRTGVQLTPSIIRGVLSRLDEAMLLENGAFATAHEEALRTYRGSPHRPPSHAGLVYPEDPEGLSRTIRSYCDDVEEELGPERPRGDLVGMLCPHIDYERGHETYARLWRRAAPMLDDIELVIIFGTDHSGAPGQITPTRQSYKTPLGVLPTDVGVVDRLAEALGADEAFAEELHHGKEHSIELAAVWLHYFIGGRRCPVVPILCGSFEKFVTESSRPEDAEPLRRMLEVLAEATSGRKTLVIAAGDLAHVGPAFGGSRPADAVERARVEAGDRQSLEAICACDSERFFEVSRAEADSRKLCGMPPIYMMLRYLAGSCGEALGYDQCPADARGASFVSIAGALIYDGA